MIRDKDYSIISKWCKDRKWDLAIPKEMLPPLGIIISDQEKICAAGLYIDKKAKFGFMYGLFSNPKITKIKLFKAMKLCVQSIEKQAIKNKLGLEKSPYYLHEFHNENDEWYGKFAENTKLYLALSAIGENVIEQCQLDFKKCINDKEIEDFPCAGLPAIRKFEIPFVSSWPQGELSIPRTVGVQLAFQRAL